MLDNIEETPDMEDQGSDSLDDYSPDEIIEAVQELADDGTIPQEQALEVISAVSGAAQEDGNPGEVSEEDLAEAIVEAVESGDLSEEDAQAVISTLAKIEEVTTETRPPRPRRRGGRGERGGRDQ